VHAAIAARADFEHAAVMRGDVWRGTFGQYQPAPWWLVTNSSWVNSEPWYAEPVALTTNRQRRQASCRCDRPV
jgi:hypothetical protein